MFSKNWSQINEEKRTVFEGLFKSIESLSRTKSLPLHSAQNHLLLYMTLGLIGHRTPSKSRISNTWTSGKQEEKFRKSCWKELERRGEKHVVTVLKNLPLVKLPSRENLRGSIQPAEEHVAQHVTCSDTKRLLRWSRCSRERALTWHEAHLDLLDEFGRQLPRCPTDRFEIPTATDVPPLSSGCVVKILRRTDTCASGCSFSLRGPIR